ncbi:excitatory amino acid transporter-like [Xenia sp. Carnegie-2017]|uniref:excitatory amino acid transporter-like n=1 Tax=Xenia sp. Carnegie-2017 TaxID=2897299 RepID=UPI001F04A6CE|nr:excitatory amino acid transporter-like [Xenia sp. Carnegie-2017]
MKAARSLLSSCRNAIRGRWLFVLLLLAVALGIALGIVLNKRVGECNHFTRKQWEMFIGFPGELFMRMLMLLVLPLISSSIIMSLTSIDKKTAGKLGKRAALFCLFTTLVASIMAGVVARVMIRPSRQNNFAVNGEEEKRDEALSASPVYSILDMIRNMLPNNILEATIFSTGSKFEPKITDYKFKNKSVDVIGMSATNMSKFLKEQTINPWFSSPHSVQVIEKGNIIYEYAGQQRYQAANYLGVLTLSIAFGIILSGLGEQGKPLVNWFTCLFRVTMKLVELILWFSPIGIGSIIASKLATMDDIVGMMAVIGMYVAAVLVGFFIYGVFILPALYLILLKRNPLRLLRDVAKALTMAFGTSSSSSTMPVTLNCLQSKNLVDSRLAQFLLPIGTVTNVPAAGIYMTTAAVFIIQMWHPKLMTVASSVLICLSASIATFASPPIPASSPINVQNIVLKVVGIPSADIGLIIAIDWVIDRFGTILNVWSNCVACVIINHYSKTEIDSLNCVPNLALEDGRVVVSMHTNQVAIDIADEEDAKSSKGNEKA